MVKCQDNNDSFEKIGAFDYIGGKSVTSKLCEILHLNEYQDLAEVFNIPRGTVSTWHTRETTPFEIAIRAHLATGVSLQWLLLDQGEAFTEKAAIADPHSIQIPRSKIHVGQLCPMDPLSFDKKLLSEISSGETIAVDDVSGINLIDKSDTKIISGIYLVCIDELYSLNSFQRLPGGKVLINFNGTNVDIDADQIKVIGKVVSQITK